MTNPHEFHWGDIARGMQEFRDGAETPHAEAFEILIGRCMWSLLRIEHAHMHKEQ